MGTPTLEVACSLVQGTMLNTEASADVQKAIGARIDMYPSHATVSMHHAKCYVPKRIIACVTKDPQLVAAAVASFYERDPVRVKCCNPPCRMHYTAVLGTPATNTNARGHERWYERWLA